MGQFDEATYEIRSNDGRQVGAALFKTADEIFDFVRGQVAGTYTVFKELPREDGEHGSELWGYVTNYGADKIAYHATLPGA
jgi:hypothetical protein